MERLGAAAAVLLLSTLIGGCAAEPSTPRTRIGSLPFPGMFTLYEVADPDDLGVHCAGSPLARLGAEGETERGTLYTRRAGFIDLCHLRETVDWTRYLHHQIRPRLSASPVEAAPASFAFTYVETRFEVSVHPAPSPEAIDDLAILAAQRLALAVTTWHEVATWYGYQTIPGISERHSAFTWDDTTAHALGIVIGGEALRHPGADWDAAVTDVLARHLEDLEPTDPAELRRALADVRGRWWKAGVAIRRDLDTGLAAAAKHPWQPPDASGLPPAPIALPSPAGPQTQPLDAIVELHLRPPAWLDRRIHGGSTERSAIRGERGVLAVVEGVRADMQERWGRGFDQP